MCRGGGRRRRCGGRGGRSCSSAVHWHVCSSSCRWCWRWGGCTGGCRHGYCCSSSQPPYCRCCCGCCWFCWCGCSHGLQVYQGLTGQQQGQSCCTPLTAPWWHQLQWSPLPSVSGNHTQQQQQPHQVCRKAQPLAGAVWVPVPPQAQPSGPRGAQQASLQRAGHCWHVACSRRQQRQCSGLLCGQLQQQPGKLLETAVPGTSTSSSSRSSRRGGARAG